MKIEFFQTMNYHGPINIDSWPAPPRACESEWAKATYEHSLDECAAALDAGFDSLNFAEHHYSPKQLTPNPVVLRGPRWTAVQGRADRGVRHRPAAEQPGPHRRGVLDARQPPRRPAPHRDAARHAERVPHVRVESVGVARALRGRHPARAGVLHRARAVRLGGSLLPLSQHRRVAAPRAGSAPARS